MKKAVLPWLVAGISLPAQAVLGLGETGFRVAVRDAATSQPLADAFIVAREFKTEGKLHGSTTFCMRADAVRSSGAWTEIRLPSPGTDALSTTRAIEAWAYRPGYCLARTADGYRASLQKHGRFQAGAPLDPVTDTSLALRPARQGSEERLLYLGEAALGLLCSQRWSARGRESLPAIANAMIAEAEKLPRDRYEKNLVDRLRFVLAISRESHQPGPETAPMLMESSPAAQQRFARDFLLAPANARIRWPDDERGIVTVARPSPADGTQAQAMSRAPQATAVSPPVAAASPRPQGPRPASPYAVEAVRPSMKDVPIVAVQGGTAYGAARSAAAPAGAPGNIVVQRQDALPGSTELAIHCRRGAPSACNLDERDVRGETALYQFVGNLKVPEAKLLLDAGANPSVAIRPGGPDALERLLRKMTELDPAGAQAASARELLALLAASPKATLGAKLREDLMADPAQWQVVRQAKGLPLLLEARPRLLALRVRDEASGCEPLGWDRSYREGPFRLRFP